MFVLCNNKQFRSDLENNSKGSDFFFSFFVFYSIAIYRVFKRLPFSLISNIFLQFLEFRFFDWFIWLVCFNVVVWKRIQIRKKEKKKKKKEKKEKYQKEENKNGSHQILRSEMEVRSTGLKKKRWKKISWMEIPKRVNISTNQENTSYIYLYPFLFHSLCFYPTLCANKVLIWSWRLCSSDIDMTE